MDITIFLENKDIITIIIWLLWFVFWLFQYKKSIDLRRAQWLSDLYNSFYLTDKFSYCKSNIIYSKELNEDIIKSLNNSLHWKPQDENTKIIIERIDNFLNFFEFVLYLNEIWQIKKNDLSVMFDWFLERLKSHDLIMEMINKKWYEKISSYLEAA